MDKGERRNMRERSAKVQRLINGITQNPSITLTIASLQQWLDVRVDAAERILSRLASSGLLREVNKGTFVPGRLVGC